LYLPRKKETDVFGRRVQFAWMKWQSASCNVGFDPLWG